MELPFVIAFRRNAAVLSTSAEFPFAIVFDIAFADIAIIRG